MGIGGGYLLPKVFHQRGAGSRELRFCLEASNRWSPKNIFQSRPRRAKAHIKSSSSAKAVLEEKEMGTGPSLPPFELLISPQLNKNSCLFQTWLTLTWRTPWDLCTYNNSSHFTMQCVEHLWFTFAHFYNKVPYRTIKLWANDIQNSFFFCLFF